MKLKDYLSTREGAIKENMYSRPTIAGLALIILVLTFGLINKSTTVVLVPPTLDASSSVGASHSSEETQVAWGMYLTGLMGNVTPRSAPALKDLISRHLSSSLYNSMVEAIDMQVEEIVEEQVTLQFAPTMARYDSEIRKVIVTGELTIRGLRGQEKRELRTYELGFVTQNYNVLLDSMRIVEGAYQAEKKAEEK